MSILILLSALFFCGCATKHSSSFGTDRSALVIVRSGTKVQMSWQSRVNRSYTILFTEKSGSPVDKWTPLTGHINVQGTGQMMEADDYVPLGRERNYRLRSSDN